ncbi:MAG: lamin tail domain-containing protein, partial [Candidatus Hydrogenedentes bacterium]|nr:lamin tail domain-containing protein [Candidatus Hydrogenedentota bacterium]
VIYEDQHFGNAGAPGVNTPFALSENGETVHLSSGNSGVLSGYRDREDFGASERDVTLGRYMTNDGDVNFAPLSVGTPGSANADPAVASIVITEIMYDPGTNNAREEYVEIYNNSPSPVNLFDEAGLPWRFSSGIDYTLPINTVIPAFGYIVIAKDLDAFGNAYSVVAGTTGLGPYGGQLSDGEALEIAMPGDVDTLGTQYYIRQDRVRYDSKAPWPEGADGGGDALNRLDATAYGNDATNWEAAAPSPGE